MELSKALLLDKLSFLGSGIGSSHFGTWVSLGVFPVVAQEKVRALGSRVSNSIALSSMHIQS